MHATVHKHLGKGLLSQLAMTFPQLHALMSTYMLAVRACSAHCMHVRTHSCALRTACMYVLIAAHCMHVRTNSVYALMSTYMHAVRSWCTATCTCAYVHVCREHLHLGKGLIPQLRGQHDGRDDDDQDNETAQRPGNASRNTACARAHTPRTCIASGLSVRTPPLIKTNYVHQRCRANRSNTQPHII